MRFDLFKMLFPKQLFTKHLFVICMYEQEFALNNLQELICHKTQPTNQLTNIYIYMCVCVCV